MKSQSSPVSAAVHFLGYLDDQIDIALVRLA